MILETDRLILRKLNLDDIERLSEYRSKKEVSRYQSWNRYSKFTAKRRIIHCQKINDLFQIGKDYNLAIELKDESKLVGDLFVGVINDHTITLGYTLDSEYWHQGYMSEMLEAFLTYVKENGMTIVLCYIYPENKASKKVLNRFGFTKFATSSYYGDEGYKKVLKDA